MPRYNPSTIEPKWQKHWESERTFATPRLPQGEKFYVLDMFPYPSGDGLHVGHPEGQTATDIVCRYERMRGKCVLHPMGWDAFGLPAEQYAKKTGTPPRVTTEKNIGTFRRQEKMLGFSYDWSRELATTDVDYFRWTQWIFLVLFDTWYDVKSGQGRPIAELEIPPDVAAGGDEAVRRYQDAHRLAYQSHAPVNWCPALGTVLANEEVIGGLSERGHHPVVRIPLRQWMLRITAYADRLGHDLDGLDWPESIKSLQRNWIGRSTGAEVDFFIGATSAPNGKPNPQEFKAWRNARAASGFPQVPGDDVLRVFTTRPDTLYGATYMVVAPEHPLVGRLTAPAQAAAVTAYCEQAARKSDLDRTELAKEKTGVFTGSFAANPVNNRPIPIWVADYVLASYGTGAIMAVPAHDTRDAEFARQFGLELVPVVDPGPSVDSDLRAKILAGEVIFTEPGTAIHSGPYDGQPTAEMQKNIVADLAQRGQGRQAINYKLRDWLFSRQHFWGEPFPILHELDDAGQPTGLVRTIPPERLPVDLPELKIFDAKGSPDPPLEQAPADWLWVTVDGRRYKRETNTMPQWAGSCWYYLRFLDPKNQQVLVDPELERAWMPVDLYVGGAEHAVLHLLYARFWHKVLFDRGHVTTPEPFRRLINQGMILGEMEVTGYQRADGSWASAELVVAGPDGKPVLKSSGEPLTSVRLSVEQAHKQGDRLVLAAEPAVRLDSRAHKMSKSRGNVVNPDEVVKQYGADSLRLFEMFMGPLEATKPWSMDGVSGVRGFLDRVWRMIVEERSETVELSAAVKDVAPTVEQDRVLHRTIQAVTQDIERMQFNTAIAKMMEFTNYFTKSDVRPRVAMERLVLLLSPFAPHLTEELWQLFGHEKTLAYEPWPDDDPAKIREDSVEIPVQISGKLRGRVTVPVDTSAEALEQAARTDPRIAELLAGKTVVKAVVIPGKMVNFVVK
ncbi:MAG TPA: leucine--tRNA ligase [Pirellulales bacterium]|jgi:leucyl-tRNA synthetase|nr:leucine--tRNA ligase [Pirellulales bacterium]